MAEAVRERNSEEGPLAVEPEREDSALTREEASGAFRFSPLEEGRELEWDSSSEGDSPVGATDDCREGGADSVA